MRHYIRKVINNEETIINLDFLDEITREIDEIVAAKITDEKRNPFRKDGLYEKINKLNEEQMKYLLNELVFSLIDFKRKYNSCFKRSHFDFLKQCFELKEMADKAGMKLWPEMDDK